MRYFSSDTYLFFTASFSCFDSPLPIHLKEVKRMGIIVPSSNILFQHFLAIKDSNDAIK